MPCPLPRRPLAFGRAALLLGLAALLAAAAPPTAAATDGPAVAPAGTARYIVQLDGAPLAVRPLRPTPFRAAAKAPRLAPPDGAHAAALRRQQDAFVAALQAVAPGARALYHYHVAYHGVAVRLTPAQASAAARLPGVAAVTREQQVEPLMDASLDVIGARAAWADPRIGGQLKAGRGVRLAVIDSGITAAHPFFDDAGFTAPEGFPRASVTVGDRVLPFPPDKLAQYTSDKVIVARTYANPENVAEGSDPTADYDPLARGVGGFHGAHVAGTAAGISIFGAPGAAGAGDLELSGVAPGAYLMAYKFTDAYTPEILKMIDDAVADGADVINNSWGTALMNIYQAEHHPVAVAFRNAAQAGVVVVAAAGNAGENGEATLGGPHQMIPEVITVANTETGRDFAYYLTAADAELPPALVKHPAVYETFGRAVTSIERPAFENDLCDLVTMGLSGRGRIHIGPWEGACATQSPLIPFPLPAQLAWATKLINAATVQAEAVVFVTAGDPAANAALLQGLAQLLPLIATQLPEGFALPPVAVIGGPAAAELLAFADGHPTLRLTYDVTPEAIRDAARVDVVHPTSGRGPAPAGAHRPLKPDLAAPGTAILSANTDPLTGAPSGFIVSSGTSMASPHVAGAAAVLRQAWPDWTPAQVKAALMSTSQITGRTAAGDAGPLAPATVQGAGRLDLAAALDPQLLIDNPGIDLGVVAGARTVFTLTVRDARRAPEGDATWAIGHLSGAGPRPVTATFGAGVTATVGEGGAAVVPIALDTAGLAEGEYDGRITFTRGARRVHATYRLRAAPEPRDVLVVQVRRRSRPGGGGIPGLPSLPGLPGGGAQFDDGPDLSRYWTAALDSLGLRYDVWTVASGARDGAPPLSVLEGYRLVIVSGGDGDAPLDRLPGGMTSLQMYLLGGGRLLVSGTGLNHGLAASLDLQNRGAMMLLSRYFAGFDLRSDNAAVADVLRPTRLFDQPIRLAKVPSPDAAGLGGVADLGAPLAALRTQGGGGTQLPPDTGLGAVGVADRIFPYVRSFVDVDGGGSTLTGVSADASLEAPARAPGIPWRAMFAGFAVEAVATGDGTLDRAAVVRRVFEWATEPEDGAVTVAAEPVDGAPEALEVRASFTLDGRPQPGGRWRWDAGDGRGYVSTTEPATTLRYRRAGRYTVRAEVTTAAAHTFVGAVDVVVAGGRTTLYLPALRVTAP